MQRLVRVESAAHGTLFARVIQHVATEGRERVWLRPLLLDDKSGFVDLRGGSDIVLDKDKVEDVEAEMRLRVDINLAATEADFESRVVTDERWAESGTRALMDFVKGLGEKG